MEREIMMTGIGGQGVQLAAQVLARAAAAEGRYVQYLGVYGGTMRGGNTDTTIVVADGPISAPPMVSRTWAAVAMHHEFFEPIRKKLRPGSVVVVNDSLFEAPLDGAWQVRRVPATKLANELGNALVASMVLTAAFARLTGLVGLDALLAGMGESIPSYRQQHLEINERALREGFGCFSEVVAPAWQEAA